MRPDMPRFRLVGSAGISICSKSVHSLQHIRNIGLESLTLDELFTRMARKLRRVRELEKQSEGDIRDLEAFVWLMEARRR